MKIYFLVYRSWAFQIAKSIKKKFNSHQIKIFTKKENELSKSEIKKNDVIILDNKSNIIFENYLKKNPNIIFYIGWSELVNKKIFDNFLCICLHPSKLPLFRGGSPLQNQIIRNINSSSITLFKINKFIDGGPITHQLSFSLSGDICAIFKRIEIRGFLLISKFINDFVDKKVVFKKHKLSKYKIYKRRKSSQSYLNFKNLKHIKYVYFKNFVRMLTGPYPNAYTFLDKYKIKILKIKKTQSAHPLLNKKIIEGKDNANGYIICLRDCKVKILNSVIVKN